MASNRGEVSGTPMSPVELRDLRLVATSPGTVTFCNRFSLNEVRMSRDAWKAIGKPTYVVVSVRSETFAESTQ